MFEDDFDLKCAFKVKTAGPWGTVSILNLANLGLPSDIYKFICIRLYS
jgi:hypothetical protein